MLRLRLETSLPLCCQHAGAVPCCQHAAVVPWLTWPGLQREEDPISVFMGVPTMYAYLLSAFEAMNAAQQQRARAAARRYVVYLQPEVFACTHLCLVAAAGLACHSWNWSAPVQPAGRVCAGCGSRCAAQRRALPLCTLPGRSWLVSPLWPAPCSDVLQLQHSQACSAACAPAGAAVMIVRCPTARVQGSGCWTGTA